jgi:hypothetical protein
LYSTKSACLKRLENVVPDCRLSGPPCNGESKKGERKSRKGETTTAKQSVGGWVRRGVGVGVVPPHDIML